MLIDARELPAAADLRTDLCIIGAGAAGITLARELRASGLDIVLLESGGLHPDEDTQELYAGRAAGPLLRSRPGYLSSSRLRYFGGSTNHWAGWCRPLDALDFERRPWVPHSGWPFDRAHLEPYYRRAAAVCQIHPFDDAAAAATASPPPLTFGDGSAFTTKVFHLSPPTRFGDIYREELLSAERVRVVLHANATALLANANGEHVEGVRVRTLRGGASTVRARVCVLAAGAVENARLLLASNDVVPAGLGNHRDVVGRYFVDHPHIKAGFFHVTPRAADYAWWAAGKNVTDAYETVESPALGHRVMGLLSTTERAQREQQLLNFTATVHRRAPDQLTPSQAAVAGVASALQYSIEGGARLPHEDLVHAGLLARVEQAPNPDSRVQLQRERDALGMLRVTLNWTLTDTDRASMERTMHLLARELGRTGTGRAQSLLHLDEVWLTGGGGSHHLGTARMHTDPQQGVVDPECRVHGIDNLYVACSAVFPTSGAANPTLTIVALTLRLADRLVVRWSD